MPNTAAVASAYSMTFPGGTTTLPSSSNGFTITGFKNLNQTYLFRASSGSPQVTSATPAGGAVNNGNPVPFNATFTNEGSSSTIASASYSNQGGGTITFTTTAAHSFAAGQLVDITGNTPAGYNQSGAVIASVPSSTTLTVHGRSIGTSAGSWSSPGGVPTLTYTTSIPHLLHVGDSINVVNVTPNRYNGVKTLSAVLSPTQFQVLDTSSTKNTDPGPITGQGQIDTLVNPGGFTHKGTINSLTTVTLSTPNASPGTLTTPDVNVGMTAPNANSTVTTYGGVVLTTATLAVLGDAATTCTLPHAVPQTDGISATVVGTGGPTTSSYPTCRPPDVCASTTTTVPPTTTTTLPPAPTVTSLSPNTFADGATKVPVTVTGTGFVTGAKVKVSGTGATMSTVVVVNATTITAKATITGTAALGARTVTVTTTGGKGTCTGCVTIIAAPTLTSMSPSTAARGTSPKVTLTGTGFVTGAKVTGPTGVTFSTVVVVSATKITAKMKVSATAPTGTGLPVTVKNSAAAGSGVATANLLTIT